MKKILYIIVLFPALIYTQNNITESTSKKLIFSFEAGAALYSGNTLLEHKKFTREGGGVAFNFFTKNQVIKKVNIISKSSFSLSNAVPKEIDIVTPEMDINFTTKIPNILTCNINYSITIEQQIHDYLDHGVSLKLRVFTLFYKKGQIFNNQLHSLGGFISSEENGSLPDLEKPTQISYTINCWLSDLTSMRVSFFVNSDWTIKSVDTKTLYPGISVNFEKILNQDFHPPWIRKNQ